jgi:hypothetical protein
MDPDTAALSSENIPEVNEMPAAFQVALNEVHAAVEALNRDQKAAITDQAFERSAELRQRAENLKRKKEQIIREWQLMNAAQPVEPDAPTKR